MKNCVECSQRTKNRIHRPIVSLVREFSRPKILNQRKHLQSKLVNRQQKMLNIVKTHKSKPILMKSQNLKKPTRAKLRLPNQTKEWIGIRFRTSMKNKNLKWQTSQNFQTIKLNRRNGLLQLTRRSLMQVLANLVQLQRNLKLLDQKGLKPTKVPRTCNRLRKRNSRKSKKPETTRAMIRRVAAWFTASSKRTNLQTNQKTFPFISIPKSSPSVIKGKPKARNKKSYPLSLLLRTLLNHRSRKAISR